MGTSTVGESSFPSSVVCGPWIEKSINFYENRSGPVSLIFRKPSDQIWIFQNLKNKSKKARVHFKIFWSEQNLKS
jgi:hypothetical protein